MYIVTCVGTFYKWSWQMISAWRHFNSTNGKGTTNTVYYICPSINEIPFYLAIYVLPMLIVCCLFTLPGHLGTF